MTAWFEDTPLVWTRDETREVEQVVIAAYPDFESLDRLAENVGLNLAAVPRSQYLNTYTRSLLKHAKASRRLLRMIAEILADPDKAEFADRLAPYIAGHEAQLKAAVLDFKPSLPLLGAAPSGSLRNGREAPRRLAGFEQTINAAAGFASLAEFRCGLAAAEARTARILVDHRPRGTGFLVGERLLLTNWHVVAGATGALQAQFDYNLDDAGNEVSAGRKVAFAAQWDVRHSDHAGHAEELGADGPSARIWDYALVRLAEPVGKQPLGAPAGGGNPRKYFKLSVVPEPFDPDQPVLIVGHPNGLPMQLSFAAPAGARLTTHKTRVRYDTNTEAGSSGSPVFDKNWRVIALHHGSGPTGDPGPLNMVVADFNQGIPISEIVNDLSANLEPATRAELGIG